MEIPVAGMAEHRDGQPVLPAQMLNMLHQFRYGARGHHHILQGMGRPGRTLHIPGNLLPQTPGPLDARLVRRRSLNSPPIGLHQALRTLQKAFHRRSIGTVELHQQKCPGSPGQGIAFGLGQTAVGPPGGIPVDELNRRGAVGEPALEIGDAGRRRPGRGIGAEKHPPGRRARDNPDHQLGENAQSPFGAHEELKQIVSGNILEAFAPEAENLPGGGYHLGALHIGGSNAVLHRPSAPGVLRRVPAYEADIFAHRVAGEEQIVLLQRRVQSVGHHPGLHHHHKIIHIDLDNAVHPLEAADYPALSRNGRSGQAASRPPGRYRDAVGVRPAHKPGRIFGGFGKHHRFGLLPPSLVVHLIPGILGK